MVTLFQSLDPGLVTDAPHQPLLLASDVRFPREQSQQSEADETSPQERINFPLPGDWRTLGAIHTYPSNELAREYEWEEGHDQGQEEEHPRARVVIDGLEPVSEALLSRYEVVKDGDHSEQCIVCLEPLDPRSSPVELIQTEKKELFVALPYCITLPEVVAFPCLHLFHSECLLLWLAQKTTCPTCRFNVDPQMLLNLNGGSARRPWIPPQRDTLEAWIQDREKMRSSCE